MRAEHCWDFGQWSDVVRELADYNPARYKDVIKYPLAEALIAYESRLRDDAQRDFEFSCLMYQIGCAGFSGGKGLRKPEMPPILKDE